MHRQVGIAWHAQLALVLTLISLVTAQWCSGKSDDYSSNPIPLRRFNELNFHPKTCDLKWKSKCVTKDKHGGLQQKPPPYSLCNWLRQPAGLIPIDAYTLAVQRNNFAEHAADITLHGLWPGSPWRHRCQEPTYGCLNGEEFDVTILTTFAGLLNYCWPTNAKFKNTICHRRPTFAQHFTVQLDPNNAPQQEESDSVNSESIGNESFPMLNLDFAMPPLTSSDNILPWEGTWRSFGAEQLGSGKFEFAQSFTAIDNQNVMTVTIDSPYHQTCTYERRGAGELVLRCGSGAKAHVDNCLVSRLPDIGELEVAFLACNHTGEPAPASFYAAMDTPGCGNFLMFRYKTKPKEEIKTNIEPEADSKPISPVSHSENGIAGALLSLLGLWRTPQWLNYPARGVQHYSVSYSDEDPSVVLLASASGDITTCRFQFQFQPVYSYAVLDCGAPNQPAAFVNNKKNTPSLETQWVMGRCKPCNAHCRYSCGPQNDFCGAGSCDPAESVQAETASSAGALPSWSRLETLNDGLRHEWYTPQDSSCWPTKTAIRKLEQALDPTVPRLGFRWSKYPQLQPAPVPTVSINDQSFYGLGDAPEGFKALYYYEDVAKMQRPCFVLEAGSSVWNTASDMCKAALHQDEYRNWNPFIVVFPLNERHIAAAPTFAAQHRLCIATGGTGHEYNSRNSCPTGGILALATAGAFRFGAGSIFAEMHAFSAKYNRVVASGWCSTVGMVGFHLGGGHGPFAPSMGLGVDNLLEIEVPQVGRDAKGQTVVHKKIASRHHNPQLFWAMRGGGGGVWGVILSMTIRTHAVPDGGLSRVCMNQSGTFCQDSRDFGYHWLRDMWTRFTEWQLRLNSKVSTQPAFFIDPSQYKATGDLCSVTWTFNFEYFCAGGQTDQDYVLFRDSLVDVLQTKPEATQENNFKSAYEYLLTMPPNKFLLSVTNPLPPPHPPSDAATGSQNSVLVLRQAMETEFVSTMMNVLDICVKTLEHNDKTLPDSNGYRCRFHYLYTSLTANLGSPQSGGTAISSGFRSAFMLWNARILTTQQSDDTLHKLGPNSYFSESSYVMHNWTARYGGQKTYEQLLAVKKAHDPGNLFWCHHCIGDNPDDAYGEPIGAAADEKPSGAATTDFVEQDKL
ncbi:hypothetical protein CSIM01_13349 [Colletotrichum simmondsii]|uniref:FAD-binding PCMH-type domain-containing protein n=1 Tax=Colletotrichum simmondsii TaxID=703756 RepID=A0A135RZK0_9PEZI|nr:hypothetical protein CSIM01_13349 [Colletotrichum simmondsii]